MGKLLINMFVRDYENTEDPKVRESYGKFAGAVGIISNLFLCVMKILIGVFSGSIAIIADGINNMADASSSIITLIGSAGIKTGRRGSPVRPRQNRIPDGAVRFDSDNSSGCAAVQDIA